MNEPQRPPSSTSGGPHPWETAGPDAEDSGWEWQRELLTEAGMISEPQSFRRAKERRWMALAAQVAPPEGCTCTTSIVETIEQTLDCPLGWSYMPGVGFAHVPAELAGDPG